jgi:hypothetical protein
MDVIEFTKDSEDNITFKNMNNNNQIIVTIDENEKTIHINNKA